MNWLALHAMTITMTITMTRARALTMAQVSVERILNAVPEGLLIAFFAWALLRVLRKQNSGTRFAVWFLALLLVSALPLLGIGSAGKTLAPGIAWGHLRPAITIPGSWALFAFVAWISGVFVAMARLLGGLWHLRRLRRSCTAIAAADLDPSVRKTVESLGADSRTPLMIATSEEVRVPAAIGFGEPTIILPAWTLRELPPEDINVILLHEFAHLRRGDDWTNLIQKIVRGIFFFHPAVWWIESRLSVEREMACDDAVLAETSNPHGYASCLVSLLEKSMAHRLEHTRWSLAQAAVRRAREASLRLAQILDANRPAATRVWKPALVVVAVFSMACLVALPHAPQFVAFDRSAVPSSVDHVYSAGANLPVSQPSASQSSAQRLMNAAAVIPAALRTSDTLPRTSSRMSAVMAAPKVIRAHAVKRQFASARSVADSWDSNVNAPISAPLVRVSANADQELVPRFQTLVFVQIETTPYMTSGAPVWSVQVWRVTFVTLNERKRVPVSNSI
jgi:beta-lactamase regulating signal transducer with metallopeptidase domain